MVSPLTCLFWNVDGKIHLLDNVIGGDEKLNPHIIMLAEGAIPNKTKVKKDEEKKIVEAKENEIKNYFNGKDYDNILIKADSGYRANVFAVHNDIINAMGVSTPLSIGKR